MNLIFNVNGDNNNSDVIINSLDAEIFDDNTTYTTNIIVESNEQLLITNNENQDIDIDIITNSLLTIDGYDLDGYLTSASGEAFNFKQLYNEVTNSFDTSGASPLAMFNTDASYGRFNFSLQSVPEVLLLQLTDGYDIFRNNRENKNTFLRVLLNSESDISNIAVTPITTMIAEIFIKLCERDISNSDISVNDLSFSNLLIRAQQKVLRILGPDFSGTNISFLNKDPYDEIQIAIESSNNLLLRTAKYLLNANMKIYSIINNICNDYDPSLNGYDRLKDRKYRRKCMRNFFRRRLEDLDNNNKDLDTSLETDDDIRKIEREAAEEVGIIYEDISNNRKTNEEFIKRMARKFNEERERLDASGVDSETFIERLNDMEDIFETMKREFINGIPKSQPRPKEIIPETEENDYDKFLEEEREKIDEERSIGNKPRPPGGFRPPWRRF